MHTVFGKGLSDFQKLALLLCMSRSLFVSIDSVACTFLIMFSIVLKVLPYVAPPTSPGTVCVGAGPSRWYLPPAAIAPKSTGNDSRL